MRIKDFETLSRLIGGDVRKQHMLINSIIPYGKKLILEKQRPFTGCGARDASGRFFGAS